MNIPIFIELTKTADESMFHIRADRIVEMIPRDGYTVLFRESPQEARVNVKETPWEIESLIRSKALQWAMARKMGY